MQARHGPGVHSPLVHEKEQTTNNRLSFSFCFSRPGVDKLFTRRTRFGKTVEAAGRTLIGKQGEDLLLEIMVHVRM